MKPKNCHPCAEAPFGRNNYFTGKLLVERDFIDEQWFHAAKLQYHQKHLHGRGVACGLKVKQHPNPACRDRVVVIEPGAAFDCCGRTIAVPEEVCFHFADAPAVAALRKANDDKPHTLQICVRYHECKIDPVPVLYDDCGDGSRCEPNRVIESFEFDVTVDPPPPKHDPTAPTFAWKNTLNAANASRVVLHEASRRLYILTAGDPGTVFPVNTDNRDFLTPIALAGKGRDLAVSEDGKAVVVAVSDAAGWKLRAYDAADVTKPPTELTLPPNTVGVQLAVAPDGRLFGVVHDAGPVPTIQTWGSALLSPAPVAPTKVADATPNARAPIFSTDGTVLYLIELSSVLAYDIKSPTPTNTPVTLPSGVTPHLIAIAHDTAGDTLVVSGQGSTKLQFRAPDKTWSSADVLLEPSALAAAPGGAWVYALTADATDFYVRAVSIGRARKGLPQPPNAVAKVGKRSQQLVLTASGDTLFVPFLGDPAAPPGTDGGVAVLDVAEQDCGELLWRSLDGCPACDGPDCVVLATVERYHVGDALEDLLDPPTDPAADDAKHIARIDNRTGRTLLPSTQVLTEVILCMLEHCHGGDGKQGPPGPKGEKGEKGEKGDKGDKGDPGAFTPPKLVGVCRISWRHARLNTIDTVENAGNGLLIGFNGRVRAGDINPFTFAVLARRTEESAAGLLDCWCELRPKLVRGARLEPSPAGPCPLLALASGQTPPEGEFVNGAQFIPASGFRPGQEYRVVLKGDLIRADVGDGMIRSLDGNHLFPWLPDRPSGDGVEGGTFESWFRVEEQ